MKWVILAIVFYFIGCSSISKNKQTNMEQDGNKFPIEKTENEWKAILGDFSFNVMREKGTEKPFSSEYETLWDSGTYICKGCNSELFSSNTKFDAGCGWPSFYQSIDKSKVKEILDTTYGMTRVEVVCANCGGHLGHVFNDGYNQPTGLRYCINSVALVF